MIAATKPRWFSIFLTSAASDCSRLLKAPRDWTISGPSGPTDASAAAPLRDLPLKSDQMLIQCCRRGLHAGNRSSLRRVRLKRLPRDDELADRHELVESLLDPLSVLGVEQG